MPIPADPGQTGTGGTRQDQIQAQYNNFMFSDGATIASGYLTWMNAHPTQSAQVGAQAYVTSLAAQGIGTAIGSAVGATGTATNQIATGTAKGADQVAKDLNPSWLLDFSGDLRRLMLRVTEVTIGVLLILTAANHLASGGNTSLVKTAAKFIK